MARAEDSLELVCPPIAGVAMVHRSSRALPGIAESMRLWSGSRPDDDDPIVLNHVGGAASPDDLSPLARGPYPLLHYMLDGRGQPAVLSAGAVGERHLLRTVRAGREYELLHERWRDDAGWWWHWQRGVYMLALPARRRGVLVHACAFLLRDGRAVLCPGASGAGKSTLARQLREDFGSELVLLTDDRAVVTWDGAGALRAWGTPWNSSAGVAEAGDGVVAAIVFPSRGSASRAARLTPLGAGEASRRLMRTIAIPFWDHGGTDWALGLIDATLAACTAWEFTYSPHAGAGRDLVAALGATSTTG
ncbi:MAG TPA: hypothetical protein VKA84_16095 [Gemmatimonadaceae bacterium]|nr:hypothetical protein [Gemmatimonadaceae bacterium]